MASNLVPVLTGTDGTVSGDFCCPKEAKTHLVLPPSFQLKALDANRYATKKTIAQGMLDIALLTANASQLKYVLQVGTRHEFYRLMLTLITISISLQVMD